MTEEARRIEFVNRMVREALAAVEAQLSAMVRIAKLEAALRVIADNAQALANEIRGDAGKPRGDNVERA
jgi:hypothetical protein